MLLDQGRVVASGPAGHTDLPPVFADDAGVVVVTRLAVQEEDALHGWRLLAAAAGAGACAAGGPLVRCRIMLAMSAWRWCRRNTALSSTAAVVESVTASTATGHLLNCGCVGLAVAGAHHRPLAARLAIAPGLSLWVLVKGVALLDQ